MPGRCFIQIFFLCVFHHGEYVSGMLCYNSRAAAVILWPSAEWRCSNMYKVLEDGGAGLEISALLALSRGSARCLRGRRIELTQPGMQSSQADRGAKQRVIIPRHDMA
jgi:hypothetical protein